MTSLRERAERLVRKFDGMTFSGGLGTEWLIGNIESELKEACEEAIRDKIVEMCEGEDCFVAQKEQEAYEKGFERGIEEAYKLHKLGHLDHCKCKRCREADKINALKSKGEAAR